MKTKIDMKIRLQLRDIICCDKLVDKLGLNRYCIAEGADGDDWYELDLMDVIESGMYPFSYIRDNWRY